MLRSKKKQIPIFHGDYAFTYVAPEIEKSVPGVQGSYTLQSASAGNVYR